MPPARETGALAPGETSTSMCKLVSFYRQYKIEFHISGMVFCLIGGKVRAQAVSLEPCFFLSWNKKHTRISGGSIGCPGPAIILTQAACISTAILGDELAHIPPRE